MALLILRHEMERAGLRLSRGRYEAQDLVDTIPTVDGLEIGVLVLVLLLV